MYRFIVWSVSFCLVVVVAGTLTAAINAFTMPGVTAASSSSLQSPNFRFDESSLGGGGLIQSNSANFQAASSLGEDAVGSSASTNFQVEGGNRTTNDPTLSLSVTNGNASFGSFSPSIAATATSNFTVSNYTSYGYAVQLVGTPPKSSGGHTIAAMTTSDFSNIGIEQFGVNLVANTLPISIGANPNQGQFGFGVAAPNYGVSNKYRFVSGETIATAPKSSGVTAYTMSYIINVNSLTPGGQYTSNQIIICTGTY